MAAPSCPQAPVLSSLWDGLSEHLIASLYEVGKIGQRWGRIDRQTDPVTVKAPLIDAHMEMSLNWQSPFEQAGPESRAPALMAMLQSGALMPVVNALMPQNHDGDHPLTPLAQQASRFLQPFEGRTGITRLNSTQVFSGMPPVKITATALFRAWRDARLEVMRPYDKLMQWALPVELSDDGSLLARTVDSTRGQSDYVHALMPSRAPTRIGLTWKGRTWLPLVIESIGLPLSSPIDRYGDYVELAVPLTLCSLTALDRRDWIEGKTP